MHRLVSLAVSAIAMTKRNINSGRSVFLQNSHWCVCFLVLRDNQPMEFNVYDNKFIFIILRLIPLFVIVIFDSN